jgi:hypothetical protein
MLYSFEIALSAIIIFALYLQPYALSEFSHSTVGKIIFLIFIIMLASKNSTTGFLGALLLIVLLENSSYYTTKEGLENRGTTNTNNDVDNVGEQDVKKTWVIKNLCKSQDNGEAACPTKTKGGACVATEDYITAFTGIDYDAGKPCNFCDGGFSGKDSVCDWSVINDQITSETRITADDQLHIENSLRGVSS